ncbi:transcriptional regulator [Photobacterium gaetbulicola]|uniref:HTH cro/C1-type domain-containing protein n=1 Tax=Photobacterium gaetbulicola Gung47 TaxID=658445 RepID=A0A0C5WTU6_9GAMM|nr:helix-turn-helix transcriptional regulator [Photobacterium gaetbulicola]AJR09792.1 hypothetical protein H744_2c3148 [Photobacterium gaetbulicola Gung47]PSU12315.1 transcriptional regulator [Photobacterium gaetbulicola]
MSFINKQKQIAVNDSILKPFGLHIKQLRKEAALSQEELAARSGLDRTYISGIERGLRNVSLINLFKWQKRNKGQDKRYLENAYRVLLTRARQGMVVFVPEGNDGDSTRPKSYYQQTYQYLLKCGFQTLPA